LLSYLVGRWLQLVPTLALASILIFGIISLAPGDPVRMKIGLEATPEQVAAERERLGLDKPLPVRYVVWLSDIAHLDLGVSLLNSRPVTGLIAEAFPNTLRLALTAFVISLLIGLPLGCLAALHHNGRADALITALNSLGLAIPSFWLGLMLILLFAVSLQWLPPSGVGNPGQPWYLSLQFLILPTVTIALGNLSVFSRFVRSAMLEVLNADYVRTARAKGLREPTVLGRHALRNALIPVVTVLALSFGNLFSGALITETMFAYPGMGKLIYDSILGNDFNLALAGLLLATVMVLLGNLAADIAYAAIDPRITYR
jgi:peptide/nickel transport system permease protein